MTEFRLRISFAKKGSALWLSHLEVVRAMERCIRRSGLPYAISQGFSPHIKHSFSAALPVGTGSLGEYMDVELNSLVAPEQALQLLQAAQHDSLPVIAASYVAKGEPSLQIYYNLSTYLIQIEGTVPAPVPELLKRLRAKSEIEIMKKGKPKTYDLSLYVVEAEQDPACASTMRLTLLSRPEGSLRPDVILKALAEPDFSYTITALTRAVLDHQEL